MYTISPILFLIIPPSQQDVLFWYFLKEIFSPGLNLFLGAYVVFLSLFCFGSSLSKTNLIFLANIVSVGETASGVLGLGVILYTCRNWCSALSVGIPDAFLGLSLTCLQNLQPGRLILGDIAVWLLLRLLKGASFRFCNSRKNCCYFSAFFKILSLLFFFFFETPFGTSSFGQSFL